MCDNSTQTSDKGGEMNNLWKVLEMFCLILLCATVIYLILKFLNSLRMDELERKNEKKGGDMKKIIGWTMIVLPMPILLGISGGKEALIGLGIVILVLGVILGGVWMLIPNDNEQKKG